MESLNGDDDNDQVGMHPDTSYIYKYIDYLFYYSPCLLFVEIQNENHISSRNNEKCLYIRIIEDFQLLSLTRFL